MSPRYRDTNVRPAFVLGAICVALTAAPVAAQPRGDFSIRDSAGIAIVTTEAAGFRQVAFTVSSAPGAVIGVAERDWRYALLNVTHAEMTSERTILVANRGGPDLRFFAETGSFLRSVGRRGAGPGEFSANGLGLMLSGDSLITYDSGLDRLQVFERRGTFRRSVPVKLDSVSASVKKPVGRSGSSAMDTSRARPAQVVAGGLFRDGSLLVKIPYHRVPNTPGRDTSRYFRVTTDGKVLNEFGTFVGGAPFTVRPPQIRNTERGRRTTIVQTAQRQAATRPFYVRVHKTRLLYLDDNLNEVRIHALDGKLSKIIRLPGVPFFQRPTAIPGPPGSGVTLGFLVDDAGRIWVGDYRLPGDPQPRWLVLDPEGRPLGSVLTPRGLYVQSVSNGHVVGVRHDADDVESVESYRLARVTP